jgi:soluble lytic murein transglycosylase-like protein
MRLAHAMLGQVLACACAFAMAREAGDRDVPAQGIPEHGAAHVAAQLALYDRPAATIPAPAARTAAAFAASIPGAASAPAALDRGARRVFALAPGVLAAARAYDIDPLLLHAIAHVESRHDAAARSGAGALGVLQVMPATARRFGVEHPDTALLDPGVNLSVGAAYLKFLQARFGNDLPLVLAAYNAGEAAVARHGGQVPPFAETRGYVTQVLAEYRALRALVGRPQ